MNDETTAGSIHPSRRRMDWINYHQDCLVVVVGPISGEKFPLTKDCTLIGRQKEADVSIEDPLISRKHAEVVRKPGGAAVLHDLGSKNGTFCNDDPVQETELKEGDLIQIGNSVLKYVGPSRIELRDLDETSEASRRDGLTGLLTKQSFLHFLNPNLVRCKDLHAPLSFGLIDLDEFKKVHGGPGPAAGNRIFQVMADLFKNAVRPTDVLARYDDDAFALILPLTNLMGSRIVGERLRNLVADHRFQWEGLQLSVTVSVGMAERRGGVEDAELLIDRAEEALREAKLRGGNLTYCFMAPV